MVQCLISLWRPWTLWQWMAFESSSSIAAAAAVCYHLSEEAPAAPSGIKPAFNEQSPQLLPGQPPAGHGNPTTAISTEQVCLLRFCKQEKNAGWELPLIYWADKYLDCCSAVHDQTLSFSNQRVIFNKGWSESTLLTKPFLSWQHCANKQSQLETEEHTNCTWKQCVVFTNIMCLPVWVCIPVSGSSACCLSALWPADGCCLRGDSACCSGSASTPVSSATRKKIWKWTEQC